MIHITPEELLTFARKLDGKELTTLYRKAAFSVSFNKDTLVFTPTYRNKPRPHEMKYLRRVCDDFSKSNSLRPKDYADGTRNASYTLTLIAKYLDAKGIPHEGTP